MLGAGGKGVYAYVNACSCVLARSVMLGRVCVWVCRSEWLLCSWAFSTCVVMQCAVMHLNPELMDSASLVSQLVLKILSIPHTLGSHAGSHPPGIYVGAGNHSFSSQHLFDKLFTNWTVSPASLGVRLHENLELYMDKENLLSFDKWSPILWCTFFFIVRLLILVEHKRCTLTFLYQTEL